MLPEMEISQVSLRAPRLSCCCLSICLLALPAWVDAEATTQMTTRGTSVSSEVNLVQASEIAREQLGGEVIKAELTQIEGIRAYRVRLLEEGRIRDVLIDAANGNLLQPEQPEQAE